MKNTVIQLACLVGFALVMGTTYNLMTGKLKFFVKEGRYPNALVCSMGKAPEPRVPVVEDPAVPGEDPKVIVNSPPGGGTKPSEVEPKPGEIDPDKIDPDKIPHLGFEDCKSAWEDGILFIDARATKYYIEGHIPGAVSVPAWEPDIAERIEKLVQEEGQQPVIVYCNKSIECEDSHIVGSQLKTYDFTEIQIWEGGYPGWIEHKMAVVKGEERGSRGPAEEGGK